MKFRTRVCEWLALSCGPLLLMSTMLAWAQSNSIERTFPQSKEVIERAIKVIQADMAGRLPVLEGFATPGEYPLDRYQRGYYQAIARVLPNASGACVVRIKATVTAWYSDPSSSHSGYQLLASSGRIESDLLDRLAEQLAVAAPENVIGTGAPKPSPVSSQGEQPSAPEPVRKFPDSNHTVSSSIGGWETSATESGKPVDNSSPAAKSLQAEVNSLEEILKNTAHPRNLVAVKKSGTPVVSTPSLSAKPQFLASMHDEFELLDFDADWVHVRISGLSRGWIWRNSVEMPASVPDTAPSSTTVANTAADLFHVVREETAPFPGDWEPLRGRNVKIISVQKVDESSKNAGLTERLEYSKYLLEKTYTETIEKQQEIQGIVVIFDSADGGMIAATAPVLRQWRAGTLTDSALWHKCFFDPPETFDSAGSSGSK